MPIAALIAFGPDVAGMLTAGQHGTTFGGNPLAAAAALAVLETIEEQGLLAHASAVGQHLVDSVLALGHPLITEVRGAGLLRAIVLSQPVAAQVAALARGAGFIVNPVAPQAIRLAPPLVVSTAEVDSFINALPALLDAASHPEDPS